jgi:hypothetical protein
MMANNKRDSDIDYNKRLERVLAARQPAARKSADHAI